MRATSARPRRLAVMRAALVVMVGCATAPPPPPPPVTPASPCDPVPWLAARTIRQRTQLAGGAVTVLANHGDTVEIADASRGSIISTTVPRETLVPVAARETPVSLQPGAPPVSIWLEIGFPLPEPATVDWVHVHETRGISFTGWVPASARTLFWELPPEPTPLPDAARRHWRSPIHEIPVATTPAIAQLADDAAVAILEVAPGGWTRVAASWVQLRFEGWTLPAPPAQFSRTHVYDFSDDLIDGVEPRRLSAIPLEPSCIFAAPHDPAQVIGLLGRDAPPVVRVTDGWGRVELPTPWGSAIGFVRLAR